MGSSISVELITDARKFAHLESDWNRLWQLSPKREIFTSFAWASTFISTHNVATLAVAVLRRRDEVSAILPLYAEAGELRFVGSSLADYSDLLCDTATSKSELVTLLASLRSLPYAWRQCVLSNLSESSRLFGLAAQANLKIGFFSSLARGHRCPTIVADDNGTEVFVSLQKKSNPKRCQMKLEARGKLEFEHLEELDDIDCHLPNFMEQHRLRRIVSGNSGGLFMHESSAAFFRALCRVLDPKSTIRFAVMRLDGKPLAYHFGFELDQRFTWYMPTFDVDYWSDRPGLVLLRKLFIYAEQRRLREFDFTVGEEPYKDRFANQVKQNWALTLYPKNLVGLRTYSRRRLSQAAHCLPVSGLRLLRKAALKRHDDALSDARRKEAVAPPRSLSRSAAQRRTFVLASKGLHLQPDSMRGVDSSGLFRTATLSELARLWLSDSWGVPPPVAQQRFANGDRAFVAVDNGRIVELAWSTRAQLGKFMGELGITSVIASPEPTWILYERLSRVEHSPFLSRFLSFVAAECHRAGHSVWLHWDSDEDEAQRKAIRLAGFIERMVVSFPFSRWTGRLPTVAGVST